MPATLTLTTIKFPFNWVPLREGTTAEINLSIVSSGPNSSRFPFNWVPLREGTPQLTDIERSRQ